MLVFLALFGLIAVSDASVVQTGSCDQTIAVLSNFDLTQFLGTWYEISRTPNNYQNGDCTTITFASNTDGTLSVVISGVANNFAEEITGNITYGTEAAKLQVNLSALNSAVEYWVIETDYSNYAWMYSCQNVGENREINVWKLSRASAYANELIPAYLDTSISNTVGIDPSTDMVDLDNSDMACYILPVLTLGEPVIIPGQCDPTITIVQNFDVARFLGRWHEIASYASESATGECNKALYSLNDDGTVRVDNSQIVNQTQEVISGFAVVASTDGSANLSVTLEILPGVTAVQELLILATDYENYAVSYTCVNIDTTQKRVYSWIVSRTTELSSTAAAAVDQVVSSYLDLNYDYFIDSDQSEEACFYYPEYVQGQPVIFPGTCNQTIQTVENFDAVRYMGLWHEIEAYPSAFQQESTCNNAFYSLTDVVEVYNTQVANQTLDEIYGFAVVASTDGTAKLNVTFPVDGNPNITVTISYWVLATDYDTYSLVYTCEPLGDDIRGVWSWKLSRTKSLPAAAATTMNSIINDINVLDDRYYESTDQSEEGCFYYPEARVGEPVVFPGQCDETISAVANFNLNQFSGTWYEVEAYPKDDQPGQCVSHEFTVSGTTGFSLASNQIANQFLIESNSTVAFTSTDGSGRFSINFVSNGTAITIPYWILATDYTDYALAYSCVNLNSDFRGIWSWKLSRSQSLSTAAQTAINNVIEPIVVLDNVYYETIDQTEDACFYLPDLSLNEPVILPGTCDQTIAAMPNFDPTRYVGRWFDIESYYDEFQQGTCNDALYTLTPAGIVDVYNTQVINQTLDTINGTAVLASTDGSGKLLVTFPVAGTDFTIDAEYWILDTDYDTYSLVYSCRDMGDGTQLVYSWKLSRFRALTEAANTAIDTVIDRVRVLNSRFYIQRDHSDDGCFYYPDFVEGEALIFRGQCDETIIPVQNFDVAAYLGLWYDIASYPQEFQFGSCPTATYTLNSEGSVDVFNTQVINETLDTITGRATVASNDGSAVLNVTFPIDIGGLFVNVVSPYWVLATDYNNYALVYSCVEIDEEYKRVTSWKLGRQPTLSAAGETAINAVTSGINVLDERYFIVQDHSDEGCFYYPEPVAGEPVVFPGTCDETVATVTNLDFTRFQGEWYEVAAYPKIQAGGQCITYNFTAANSSTFSLITNQVTASSLETNNADVVLSSTDGTAKFTITVNNNGTDIVIPYWILATDYDSYALAYSCVNLENNFRGVYSWKLSRTSELTTAAATAISQVIETNLVLGEEYFETVEHTDDACFYLPDIPAGESVIIPGQCDESISVVQNFDPTRYVGRWYDIESYFDEFQQGTCNDALYTLTPDGIVDVYNTQVVDETLDTINGTAILATTDGSGKLLVTFPVAGTFVTVTTSYWILDTDYDSYSLVYSCSNVTESTRRVFSWKLSRTQELTDAARTAINAVIDTVNVLDNRYYISRNHTAEGCFYYPELTDGQAVFFRGQCDETVQAVQNFDAVRYMGFWYDVGSYPQEFQFGTCPTATYTLNDAGFVEVFNTQVINQTLDTIDGTAVVASDDGSAKLTVNFPIAGTNLTTDSPYWVLATDYDSYSLVYSCVNIDEDTRRVTSWKLSRSSTLSTAAQTAINTVVNNIQVLDERYYLAQSHSDESCFYYPQPVSGLPVVFPGTCDESVTAVSNFDLTRFAGLWYEISAYPKNEVSGQCINYNFTAASSTTFNLLTTQVIDELLDLSDATVVLSSTDGSATFNININVNGTDIVIPYWIIDTDYDNYALAYSCVNMDNNMRGVYSWKLSRDQTLSTASQTAIAQTIDSIVVLDEQYFETTDQSDNGCFFLPDIQAGEPIIFNGQCDENLTVMQNFDPTRYVGRWYDIESYYDQFQDGTCNDALYTLTPEGIVDVYNTQVIDQTLDTINGTAVLATTDGSGKLLVTFPVNGTDVTITTSYWILDTDYVTYSLVYSCNNLTPNTRQVYSWKLSRTRQLFDTSQTSINTVISSVNVLNQRYYIQRNHTADGCFYYPEPVSGQTVTFRGQCDDSLQAVQNFDVAGYLGTWYEIESYPQQYQFGTCPTATYSLNSEGTVDVLNTQVINQQLDTTNLTAAVDSTDGSAKLIVTLEETINGIGYVFRSPYWVMATDYNNYALVYSCVNIDASYYTIASWKLSRTSTLAAASETAINTAMANIQELDQRYYETSGQSTDDCFFYVENNGGPIYYDGQCNDDSQNVVTNFDTTRFSGTWHEIAKFPSELDAGECTSQEFVADGTGFSINLNSIIGERLVSQTGYGVASTTGAGTISASFTTLTGDSEDLVLYVLDTDYDSYALVSGCRNIDSTTRQVYSWKLSRSKSELPTTTNEVFDTIISNTADLFEGYYEYSDQTDDECFYYPVYDDLTTSIVLPGACDESIVAIPNFSAADYLGLWYEIARYPQTWEDGECARAEYSLGDGVVDVYNTIVFNETLGVQEGYAVVASTDGSGLLEVTFDVNGVTNIANYYVMATDYVSYSLVYSCRNLEDGTRQVSSWKLSRTNTLSSEASAIMDPIINATQGLLEDYYKTTSQSDEDCFYIPEVNEEEAVIFRGQCEDVSGVQGFDVQRYLGWWHEIERYPTGESTGSCLSTELQSSGSSYIAIDTSVSGTVADISTSTVEVLSDGRIRRTLSNGETIDIYILATDYENYSLLYSCVNIDSEYRRVWSAKHSKTRTLSQAAETAMASVITNNRVLYSQFYIPVDQSDEACFYYPEQTGQQVILPGQCDENIPVQQNFNAIEYSGTWYQIERYPQIHEVDGATCTGARYSVNEETGVVTLLNWEIIDGELETIEGTAEISSTDGSAKLIVELPVRGSETEETVTTNLYVLTTDYVSYSLAYSCDNVDSFTRAVGVWKLSRTRSMPTSGTTAINSVISQRDELYQPYFIQVTQSEDCDEPSSAYLAKSSVLILLICVLGQLFM